MGRHIAIVGMGPTGIYSFQKLIENTQPLTISIFEAGSQAGVGMPYSADTCRKSMLANIASIEIPELPQTYLGWMETLPKAVLRGYGIDPEALHDRLFTPRLLLGQYFRSQFIELLHIAESYGHIVHIHDETKIVDVLPAGNGVRIADTVAERDEVFDRVILTTGHVWPDEEENTDTYFPSPWTGLFDADIPAVRVGVMGTSLSSIDAAMAVAAQHGSFKQLADGSLLYELAGESDALEITLMSRSGILPEADFYCPIPYERLRVMTEQALETARAVGHDGLLDRIFDLFKAEICADDPDWAEATELSSTAVDEFADVYFEDRLKRDPFRWAETNLEEVERNKAEKQTVAWRYAILRMHEKVEAVVADLSNEDRKRFEGGLKRVFVDNYAAIPSETIWRLLSLRDAGVLKILALGPDYDRQSDETGTTIKTKGQDLHFDLFIDARGQKALETVDLPFPTLKSLLLEAGCEVPEVADDYSLLVTGLAQGQVAMGAIPYLMHDRPFVQGIIASAEIGQKIGAVDAPSNRRQRAA